MITNTYLIAFHCIYNKGQPPQWKTTLDIWEPPRIPLKNLASLGDSSSFTARGNREQGVVGVEDHIVFKGEWGTTIRRGQSIMAGKWKIDCMPINCLRPYIIMNSSFVLLNNSSLIRLISKSQQWKKVNTWFYCVASFHRSRFWLSSQTSSRSIAQLVSGRLGFESRLNLFFLFFLFQASVLQWLKFEPTCKDHCFTWYQVTSPFAWLAHVPSPPSEVLPPRSMVSFPPTFESSLIEVSKRMLTYVLILEIW